MTQDELAAIRERTKNAGTPPWRVAVDDEGGDNWLVAAMGTSLDGKNYYVTTDHVHASEYEGDAATDADFIAHARTDIPELLHEVIWLRAILKERWICPECGDRFRPDFSYCKCRAHGG